MTAKTEARAWPVTPARQVKDAHVQLYERHARPAPKFTGFYREFIDIEAGKAKTDPMMRGRDSFMFYPVSARDAERGGRLVSYIASGLRDARTYQVTAEMTDAVNGMYQATRDKVSKLSKDEIIAPSGFAWLDQPWVHVDLRGKTVAIRAVSWSPQPVRWGGIEQVSDGTRVCHWTHKDDYDEYREGSDPGIRALYGELGDLALMHTFVWPHEVRFSVNSDPVLPGGVAVTRPDGTDDPMTWLHCLWMLLDAEITVSRQAPLDRHARRRAQHANLRHDDIQVITLRRARHAELDGDYEPVQVDWSCRWLVQGHWRHGVSGRASAYPHHHFVPSQHRGGASVLCQTCGQKGYWVRPYVKGPDDKPLRQLDQVWRLSR